jgi:hypothetical protein
MVTGYFLFHLVDHKDKDSTPNLQNGAAFLYARIQFAQQTITFVRWIDSENIYNIPSEFRANLH